MQNAYIPLSQNAQYIMWQFTLSEPVHVMKQEWAKTGYNWLPHELILQLVRS